MPHSSFFHRSTTRRAQLQLETLEDRDVPSGTPLDLTSPGAWGSINNALFQQCDAQPTGTGVIRSFVRMQTANGNASVEQGYNTDHRPLQFDENRSPQFTRSLRLGDVPVTFQGSAVLRQFLLDINQRSSDSLLSLDELRVYVGSAPNLHGYDAATKHLAGLTPVYDLDAVTDNWVKLDYRLNSGSGSGDMYLFLPNQIFTGASSGAYVYVYSKFGVNLGANAGFEEWATISTPAPTQLGSLSGYVYRDEDNLGVRDANEIGIPGVEIILNGTDVFGEPVFFNFSTDETGFYQFAKLLQGLYTITESQPELYEDGLDTIGTQGGQVDDDRLFDIFLEAGEAGEENNFGEGIYVGS